jgi:alpha-tubulin suppressor-like RCC1 family protein
MQKWVLITLSVGVAACSGSATDETPNDPAGASGAGNTPTGAAGAPSEPAPPVAPDTTITNAPSGTLPATGAASFEFGCDQTDCSFECSWDAVGFAPCTSPVFRGSWSDGGHTFAVRASHAGLADETPATAHFTVDAVVPSLTFAAAATEQPNSSPSTFQFSCSESDCNFECSLDGGVFTPCGATAHFDGLAPGAHQLAVRAHDTAGNPSVAATHNWSLSFGWRSLAVADFTACAVSGERELYCWGSDQYDLLGDGLGDAEPAATAAVPTRVGNANVWQRVVAGRYSMCAFTVRGERYCWGANIGREFGDPALTEYRYGEPTLAATLPLSLTLGEEHACAVDDQGLLRCWGEGSDGKLGDGNLDAHEQAEPAAVGSAHWRAASVGQSHTCGIQTDGTLHCFGVNENGECGQLASTAAVAVPTQVGTDTDWATVASGAYASCALKNDHRAYCWGYLGSGSQIFETPTQVGSDTDWKSISVHSAGVCGVKQSGEAYCWGTNDRGQLGSTTAGLEASAPTRVGLNLPAADVFGHDALRCALTTSAQISCWGNNEGSGGGLGRGVRGSEPVPIALDSGYVQLAVTAAAYGQPSGGGCGIKEDGKLYCWGFGKHVGQADTLLALTPTAISEDTDWTQISLLSEAAPLIGVQLPSDYGHACGIHGGALYCWGANSEGQLGLIPMIERCRPWSLHLSQKPGLECMWTPSRVAASPRASASTAGATTARASWARATTLRAPTQPRSETWRIGPKFPQILDASSADVRTVPSGSGAKA